MAIVGAAMQIAFWAIVIPTGFYLLTQTISTVMYSIGMMFFAVMDMLQSAFRKLAGLGGAVEIRGKRTEGDLLTAILASDIVIDVLLSVAVFAVGLVIVASIVQIIRLEYTTEGSKNSKEQIFAKAGKSLIMFILIPVVCFVGIRVANYLLQAIDYATSRSGASTVSGTVFVSAAAEANKVYDGNNNAPHIDISNLLGSLILNNIPGYGRPVVENGTVRKFPQFKYVGSDTAMANKGEARTYLAEQVNQAFCMASENSSGILVPGMELTADNISGTILTKWDRLSYMNVNAVNYFYHLGNVNYLILYLGCYFGIKTLFTACMGLIARLYKVIALFVISPAAIGLQPIDDGAAYKKWKGEFIKNVLSAYGIVIALNLYFVIVGVLQTVNLFPGWWNFPINMFIRYMMVLTGATMINELSSLIGGLIGANDLMADGQKAASAVGEIASKVGGAAMGVATGGAGAIAGKVKGMAAKKKSSVKMNADGTKTYNRSVKDTDKLANMNDEQLAKASDKAANKFADKYDTDAQGNIYKKNKDGSRGKELKGTAYEKANDMRRLADVKEREKLRDEARKDQTSSKVYAEQRTKMAQGDLQSKMSMNRLGGMVGGMFGSVKNLAGIGAMENVLNGKASQERDQKFLKKMEKSGVDVEGILGTSADDMKPQASFIQNGLDHVQGKIDKVSNRSVNKNTKAAKQAMSGHNIVSQTNEALDTQRANAASAEANASAIMSELKKNNSNVDKVDMKVVEELKKAITESMKGDESVLAKLVDKINKDTSANVETKQMVNNAWSESYKKNGFESTKKDLDTYETYRDAQETAKTAKQTMTNIDQNRDKIVDDAIKTANDNIRNSYGKVAPKFDENANIVKDSKTGLNVDESFAEAFAKAIATETQKAGLTNQSGNQKDLAKAIEKLESKLAQDGIKAELKNLDQTKLKFDDTNITKILSDIQRLAQQNLTEAKKKDDQTKLLEDIKKALEKGGKK